MNPTLGAALLKALQAGRNLGPRGMPVTEERASAVFEAGYIEVDGRRIPVTGFGARALRAGQKVAVAWQKGQPVMAIRHSARRTGAVGPMPQLGGVVEELFIALDPATGQVDVWFRNDQQVTNLGLRTSMNADPAYVKWSTRSDAFVVGTAAHHYYICTLARSEDTALGSASAAASIVRHENPLDAGIALLQAQNTFTLTGETKYWSFSWNELTPLTDPGTLTEATPNVITGSRVNAGTIYLTRAMVESADVGDPSPRALITDIQLDDRLELIFVLSLNLNNAASNTALSIPPLVPPGPIGPTFNHPVEKGDGSGPVQYVTVDDVRNADVGAFSTHVVVVNVTTGAILFKSYKDPIVQTVETGLTRLQTLAGLGFPVVVEDFSGGWAKGGDGDPFEWASGLGPTFPGPFEFQYTDLVCDYTERLLPGVTAYTFDDFDATQVPYLDLTSMFGQDTSTIIVEAAARAGFSGFFSDQHWIKATFTGRRIWMRKRYHLSAVYLPRRATSATTLPLGMLLVKVKLDLRATATASFATSTFGFFLHDLDTGSVTTLAPMAPGSGSSIQHPGGGFFFSQPPETDGTFVVLGFNGTHLLWWHSYPSGSNQVVDIKLTQVSTGATVTAISGFTFTNTTEQALLDFVLRVFQVLRPDFFYYPSDTDDAGHNFVEAWDAQGVPTLNASAAGFPTTLAELERVAALLDLPEDIEPDEDTIILRNGGPVNVEDLTHTGPSWHVVQDTRLISGSLTPDP